jgi:hypothetical protein
MVLTVSPRRRTRHWGVSSGLTLSGPPVDSFFRLATAQPARADHIAQVPGEGIILRRNYADRGPDAHRDRLASALGRVSSEPGPATKAERARELSGQHRTLIPQPIHVAGVSVLLASASSPARTAG